MPSNRKKITCFCKRTDLKKGPGVMECKVSKENQSVTCVKLYHEACLRRNNIELPRYKKDFICPFCNLQALVSPNDQSDPSESN